MPYGLYVGMLLHGVLIVLTLTAPRRPAWLARTAFFVAAAYNEAPFLIFIVILVGTVPTLLGATVLPDDAITWTLLILLATGLGVIAWRGTRARPAIERALGDGLGAGWRDRIDPALRAGLRDRPPWWIVLMPIVFPRGDVQRLRNISYGAAGSANRLDLYRQRSGAAGAPVLVYFHGGGYNGGRKSVEARALLYRFASRGWVTISANYRLRPSATFVDHLTDVKLVIAWIKAEGVAYGIDPGTIVLSGGSAGGHLATMAGLTQNDPRYQSGFEDVDTSVWAVASFYGWYDGYYGLGGVDSTVGPLGHDPSSAPPFFIAHGTNDTLALVEYARLTAAHLRAGSRAPVVYAELPHGQHAFDLFHSFRFCAVVDGLEAFTAVLRSGRTSHGTG
jgi:acetyl esterase/lipase